MTDFTWNDENKATLVRMLADGASGGEIAKAIGTTRNSVIGKAHRLRLPLKKKQFGSAVPSDHANRKAAEAMSAKRRKPIITLVSNNAEPAPEPVDTPKVAIRLATAQTPATTPDFGPRTIMDLGRRHCRYPLFKGREPIDQKFYCGEPRFDGPYCMHHAEVCSGVGTPSERRAHLEAAE